MHDSFRVQQVLGMFDVPSRDKIRCEWNVSLPLEELSWQIGLIVGPSGSGKSTIASELFRDARIHTGYEWPQNASVLDGFPTDLDGKSITEALSSVGFSSPPHWLKSWHVLSNGQKFRAELARLILEPAETVVFDEFTSVIDRDVAKVCCAAVSKTLRRRQRPRLVAISCHYDIIDWLQPDWVYDVGQNRFESRSLRRRPPIRLKVHRVPTSAWQLFRGHHYLTADIARRAQCYVAFWDGRPVAFTSYIHFPHASSNRMKREHRTVVLPDFQGVGIGNALSEWLGRKLTSEGWRFLSTTSHPAMMRHRARSPLWRIKSKPRHVGKLGRKALFTRQPSCSRVTASFEFIGGKSADERASAC